ncbi:hypothetical protein [Micromonospora sp. WMMD710]|uniref:hypothetical protein n=1 Tax=Micromonospora sp. WMMD710 TaxID=3016085 RepID=UPI002417496A|nr:hypothetical protein [Micromonospora sp. WMMD710]MDG4760538.1 hypothetical protein [Micromonospora sp. WMMD710]
MLSDKQLLERFADEIIDNPWKVSVATFLANNRSDLSVNTFQNWYSGTRRRGELLGSLSTDRQNAIAGWVNDDYKVRAVMEYLDRGPGYPIQTFVEEKEINYNTFWQILKGGKGVVDPNSTSKAKGNGVDVWYRLNEDYRRRLGREPVNRKPKGLVASQSQHPQPSSSALPSGRSGYTPAAAALSSTAGASSSTPGRLQTTPPSERVVRKIRSVSGRE